MISYSYIYLIIYLEYSEENPSWYVLLGSPMKVPEKVKKGKQNVYGNQHLPWVSLFRCSRVKWSEHLHSRARKIRIKEKRISLVTIVV